MPLSSESGKALLEIVFRLCIGLWAVLPLISFTHTFALGTRLSGEGLGRHRHWVMIHQDTLEFARRSMLVC